MKHVICPVCGRICTKYGKTKAGSQRWFCKNCKFAFSPDIDTSSRRLKMFLDWLFGRDTQKSMPGEGRAFRRKTAEFWEIWPLPPIIEEKQDVVYVDGIYLGRKACILICCNREHVLGWYLCRFEHSRAWTAPMSRIAEPEVVVSDGGTGFAKALRKAWPQAKRQRCVFHVFCQVKRYTTTKPKTQAGMELYLLARDLLHLETRKEAEQWTERYVVWIGRYREFLNQMTFDEYGHSRPRHERLLKAQRSLLRLLKDDTMFTYLDESLQFRLRQDIPSTNNRIEGGMNARLREMLRDHRGLSIERRMKAVFWWCYMHSPEPLSPSEILNTMPADKSIAAVYLKMSGQGKRDDSIPQWGDAIVRSELHRSADYPVFWD